MPVIIQNHKKLAKLDRVQRNYDNDSGMYTSNNIIRDAIDDLKKDLLSHSKDGRMETETPNL